VTAIRRWKMMDARHLRLSRLTAKMVAAVNQQRSRRAAPAVERRTSRSMMTAALLNPSTMIATALHQSHHTSRIQTHRAATGTRSFLVVMYPALTASRYANARMRNQRSQMTRRSRLLPDLTQAQDAAEAKTENHAVSTLVLLVRNMRPPWKLWVASAALCWPWDISLAAALERVHL